MANSIGLSTMDLVALVNINLAVVVIRLRGK